MDDDAFVYAVLGYWKGVGSVFCHCGETVSERGVRADGWNFAGYYMFCFHRVDGWGLKNCVLFVWLLFVLLWDKSK